jgi:GAF domain-containing protein
MSERSASEAKRRARYAEARERTRAVLRDETDEIARLATAACLISAVMDQASFVGFYRVIAPGVLAIGPFQGPLACLRIPFERGVCGAAAREGRSQLVPDVHAFPGHIACDAGAQSELVVPVRDASGEIVAVLDLDSHRPAAFDELDREELERWMELLFRDSSAR